jgi:hypothetical protein
VGEGVSFYLLGCVSALTERTRVSRIGKFLSLNFLEGQVGTIVFLHVSRS